MSISPAPRLNFARFANIALLVISILIGLVLILAAQLIGGENPPWYWKVADLIGNLLALSVGLSFGYEWLMSGIREERQVTQLRQLLSERLDANLYAAHPDGRPSPEYKAQMLSKARKEVVDLGTALSAFTSMFRHQRSGIYQDVVLDLLRRNVDYTCLVLDPDWLDRMKVGAAKETQEIIAAWSDDIRKALTDLDSIQAEIVKNVGQGDGVGAFTVLQYQDAPYFGCLCIDGDTPRGHMLFTPYLHGVENSDAPTFEVTRQDNPVIFDKWFRSVQNTKQISQPVPQTGQAAPGSAGP